MPKDTILELLWGCESMSKVEMLAALAETVSDATLKRVLQQLVNDGRLEVRGRGRATRYSLSASGRVLSTVNLDTYFSREIDERHIITNFNFDLFTKLLPGVDLFTAEERAHLQKLHLPLPESYKQTNIY